MAAYIKNFRLTSNDVILNNATSLVNRSVGVGVAAVSGSVTSSVDDAVIQQNEIKVMASSSSNGERHLAVTVCVTFILVAMILLTVTGNCLVVIAVTRYHRLRDNVTNTFVLSLALADLTVALLVMPFALLIELTAGHWPLGLDLCRLWISCDVTCCTASILHLCLISLDRYLAITRPLTYHLDMSPTRAKTLVCAAWLCSIAISFLPVHLDWYSGHDDTVKRQDSIFAFTAPNRTNVPHSSNDFVLLSQSAFSAFTDDTFSHVPNVGDSLNFNNDNDVIYNTRNDRTDTMTPLASDGSYYVTELAAVVVSDVGLSGCGLRVNRLYAVLSSMLSFYAPLAIMSIAYVRIYRIARDQVKKIQQQLTPRTHHRQMQCTLLAAGGASGGNAITASFISSSSSTNSRRYLPVARMASNGGRAKTTRDWKALKTLGVMMGLFVSCWLPFFLVYLTEPFCRTRLTPDGFRPICRPISFVFQPAAIAAITWLGYANSVINPFIYALLQRDFRAAYRHIIHCQRRQGNNRFLNNATMSIRQRYEGDSNISCTAGADAIKRVRMMYYSTSVVSADNTPESLSTPCLTAADTSHHSNMANSCTAASNTPATAAATSATASTRFLNTMSASLTAPLATVSASRHPHTLPRSASHHVQQQHKQHTNGVGGSSRKLSRQAEELEAAASAAAAAAAAVAAASAVAAAAAVDSDNSCYELLPLTGRIGHVTERDNMIGSWDTNSDCSSPDVDLPYLPVPAQPAAVTQFP